MPVNDQERSLRRRIVFNAMNGNATPAAITSAITTLETEFGDVENLRFNQLILRLQATLDSAEVNLSKVLGEIMTLRSLPAEEIGPDPGRGDVVATATVAKKQPAATPMRSGMHAVFATMLETVAAQLRHRGDDSHLQMVGALTSSPSVNNLGSRIYDAIHLWGQSPDPGKLSIAGTPDEYRVIVHVVYVWLCEKLGPVDADRLLNAAVRAADQLPDAVTNSPRQLL